MGGGHRASSAKPAPVPKQAAVATEERMSNDTRETEAKKRKKKYKLEDTLSIFDQGPDNESKDQL